ncbi:MAG: PIN domain-containing protein [Rhizonema sp. NSF051]|nr:PIN domain-containing protein [Rhizonema sp. NSF051]
MEVALAEYEVRNDATKVKALSDLCSEHCFTGNPRLRDPNDGMLLEVAVNGQAFAIVTFNKRDYCSVPAECGIEVLLPREAIKKVQS